MQRKTPIRTGSLTIGHNLISVNCMCFFLCMRDKPIQHDLFPSPTAKTRGWALACFGVFVLLKNVSSPIIGECI